MSLLERVLVLGFMGAFVTAGLSAYEPRKQSSDLQVTKARIATGFVALNALYEQYCAAVTKPIITSAALLETGLIANEDFITPFNDTLSHRIDWVANPVMLSISMEVDAHSIISFEKALSPTLISGTTFTWKVSPDFVTEFNEAWLYRVMYEPGCL